MKYLRCRSFICFILCCYFAQGQSFTSSNLPIVVINSSGRGYTVPVDSFWYDLKVSLGIIYNGPGQRNNLTDPFNNYNGETEIRVQGSSSVAFPKRSFRLSLINSSGAKNPVSLLGMPAHDDWVLKALYQDKSLLRDDLAFRIYNQMGHYSSRSVFVEVVVDGEYKGIYQLLEKIRRDKDRVNISKLKQDEIAGDDLTGGYIISIDKFVPNVDQGWYSKYRSNGTGDSSNFFLYYYPKPDSIMPQQKAYIKNYVDQFEDALSVSTKANPAYRNYIGVTSFIDFFIINELAKNVDGYRASTYLYKDKSSSGDGKLQAGPIWDFNIGFGNASYNGGDYPYDWAFNANPYTNFIPWWWKRFMGDSAFNNDLRCRYQELRKNVLSENGLQSYIDAKAASLSEAQQRNFTKYPILGTVVYPNPSPPPADYNGEVGRLKWWIGERLKWMDQQLAGTCIVNVKQSTLESTDMNIYPNPFNKNVTLKYRAQQMMNVSFDLTNLLGEPMSTTLSGVRSIGMHEEKFETSDLPAGAYILRMNLDGNIYYQKILKLN